MADQPKNFTGPRELVWEFALCWSFGVGRANLAAGLLSLLLVGCSQKSGSEGSGSGFPGANEGVRDFSALLQSLQTEGTAPPTKAAQYRQFDVVYPAAGIMIPNRTLVYFKGGKINPDSDSRVLVAMQADADKTGGWVLLENGEVQDLTASEIQALKPAGEPIK
ncbi:MAG TPA: hypothetical protein DCF63_09355 [Planctomycetaceae bacterium]|nr:hypothetical protein [Planctomycetaceae bacterium]